MEIRNFLTFKAIVEQGSFVKAARTLHYAQSSVTSHIKALEDYYGQPVFDRIGKSVVLNTFGQLVYKHASVLLAAYDDVLALKDETGDPMGRLRIGAPESTLLYRLAPVLRRYKELHPQVELVMENATCPQMRLALRSGELDMGILLEQVGNEPDLERLLLFEEPMSIVMPKEYPGDDLSSENSYTILYTEAGCSYRAIFQRLLEERGVGTDNVIETASLEVIKQYILCGMGVSFLPTVVVQKELAAGELKHVPWQTLDPVVIQIVRHKDKWISPAMAAFTRILQEEARRW